MRSVPRLLGAALLALAVLGPVAPTLASSAATSARLATPDGNDFSWPQCAKGVGNGQGEPLPTAHRKFMIVGLTNGTGLHENPCLAAEWQYARDHADRVTGYTVPTYPTTAERSAARTGHYGTCHTLTCRLRNNGWAQGAYAAHSLRSLGAHPPLVWVDVETRYRHPWTSHPVRNRIVVQTLIKSLQHSGYKVGIYSTSYMWHRIVSYSSSLPEWVPTMSSLTAGCSLRFSRGPVWVSQYIHNYPKQHAGYDENELCGRAPALQRMFEPV